MRPGYGGQQGGRHPRFEQNWHPQASQPRPSQPQTNSYQYSLSQGNHAPYGVQSATQSPSFSNIPYLQNPNMFLQDPNRFLHTIPPMIQSPQLPPTNTVSNSYAANPQMYPFSVQQIPSQLQQQPPPVPPNVDHNRGNIGNPHASGIRFQSPSVPPRNRRPSPELKRNNSYSKKEAHHTIEVAVENPQCSSPPVQTPNVLSRSPGLLTKQRKYGSREKEDFQNVEVAAARAWRELIASGESVSAWKVSQSVLVALGAESWDSLGLQYQEVPSLSRLILTEGKINAFIHCYVAVRNITSLYDLNLAICLNEGIEKFEDLELGPLVQHPLVLHYFSANNLEDIYRITSEEIITSLVKYTKRCGGLSFGREDFLAFIAKKCKVASWRKMGLRIQSLGMHISLIRKALQLENNVLRMCRQGVENETGNNRRKRPLFSLEKKQIDERFNAITERVESFASANKAFSGQHIHFVSSSADDVSSGDDDDSTDDGDGVERLEINSKHNQHQVSSRKISSDRASSCPYPSVAEEKARLGLPGETVDYSSPNSRLQNSETEKPAKKKRKLANECRHLKKKGDEMEMGDTPFTDDHIRIFITTWKEACREHTAAEVFEKMWQFYDISLRRRKRILKSFVSSALFQGLLNVAVASIKNGCWDSIYDTFQSIDDVGLPSVQPPSYIDCEALDVESSEKNLLIACPSLEHKSGVTVDQILRKMMEYLDIENTVAAGRYPPSERVLMLVRNLLKCEGWLINQFSVKEFKSLGYGEYLMFLEGHISLLSEEMLKYLDREAFDHFNLTVSMFQHQLITLLAQASNSLWDDDCLTSQRVSTLLLRQFPLVGFNLIENGSLKNLQHTVKENKSGVLSKNVIFSATLFEMDNVKDPVHGTGSYLLDNASPGVDIGEKADTVTSVTSKDAVEALHKAPMLIDLNSWLHWDILYAPSLGPLIRWLLFDFNAKDFLCLATREGKIIRVDHSASVESFFSALLNGSSFKVAVEILSLFALYGGKKHLPVSLLKCHARQAFDVILSNSVDLELNDSLISCINGKASKEIRPGSNTMADNTKETVFFMSRLILDCLGHLPAEFHILATEILLSALQSVAKNAAEVVLLQCNRKEEHLMLHEVGFSLGITEWIDDHHKLCPIAGDNFSMPVQSFPSLKTTPKMTGIRGGSRASEKHLSSGKRISSGKEDGQAERSADLTFVKDGVEVDTSARVGLRDVDECSMQKDALNLIESIRREEFGLANEVESNLLKKQHARLGRALHCLSQELYSQDSHFLLELIQNADDNVYPDNAEPTLVFILQETGVIILNNERGFMAHNIRALCDVGNSTKKGSSAGYIGKKGIGFKSVFRVTDAPEIHSNGFHIKFDISEGQIGFVLPTIIPPCNLDHIKQLASPSHHQIDNNCWNTCIVLPFRSNLPQGQDIGRILSMLSDIHPSILLFLHRLHCIKLRNMIDNSYLVMRKEVVGDGLMRVSYGERTMTWFIASKSLHAEVIRPDVQATEIAVAFTLEESGGGSYEAHLEQQPVFAFLPLRTYGLKFILQGDFVLPSSREEVDEDNPWNQWLLSEFPSLFVGAEKSFCELPCFRESAAKAVSIYMRFVPLAGEVHGFFSSLPRMIISKLRLSDCLLQEGPTNIWLPPCMVLRNWNEQAQKLLPEELLQKCLGLRFLKKDVLLPDSLARALGVQEYGPKILVQLMSSLCCVENGNSLKSMGLRWLYTWLNELYNLLSSSGKTMEQLDSELDLIKTLKKLPFIPLSDGTHSSLNEGTIWLSADFVGTGFDCDERRKFFPNLYATLRIVSPHLFPAASDNTFCSHSSLMNNVKMMLHWIGVQNLTAHDIIKAHILPSISDEKRANQQKCLFIEYTVYVMLHLQSSCPDCLVEKENVIAEFRDKALIFTNYGFKLLKEVPIHFGREFGNSLVASQFVNDMDYKWHEIDLAYLKHPIFESMPCGLQKLREFFLNLGITDFVKVSRTEKHISEVSPSVLQQVTLDSSLISSNILIEDWESEELACILSSLTRNRNLEKSKYLLEVIDRLWDTYFTEKSTSYISSKCGGNNITFRSSFMNNICTVQWVASSTDDMLHYPSELFHDCDAVSSVFGDSAAYAVPKIKSRTLLIDIGLKTQVTIDDALATLKRWIKVEAPFKASISQMSRLYMFISTELASSREKIINSLCSDKFIFVPCTSGNNRKDIVPGFFLSPQEVYWEDSTGVLNSMENPKSSIKADLPMNMLLGRLYPGLRDFFVHECGVAATPPFRCYLQILKQLSDDALPLEAASTVFQVLLLWSDGLERGDMDRDDIAFLRSNLLQVEFSVLPAFRDKWVSLHPSYGLVCWSDDDTLKKQFKHLDNIEFLYFGELSNDEKEVLQTKVSRLLKELGIPSISEVVTREAICYGPRDSRVEASLVAWALPFAQRYIRNVHPKKYDEIKQLGFEKLQNLKVVVVERLFYRNVIRNFSVSSKKRLECSSLLQDTTLYTTCESNSHAMFMELSRLFFNGDPELHLANFLHMLTTMVESGSTEQQLDFFILNSQNMPKPPDEPLWSISLPSAEENDLTQLPMEESSSNDADQDPTKPKKRPGITYWPPSDWKTAPKYNYSRVRTQPVNNIATEPSEPGSNLKINVDETSEELGKPVGDLIISPESGEDIIIIEENVETLPASFTEDPMISTTIGASGGKIKGEEPQSSSDPFGTPINLVLETHCPTEGTPKDKSSKISQAITIGGQQAMLTGKMGEAIAFEYFKEKHGNSVVKWVNEENETGLPYDLIVGGENERTVEFVEVKATRYAKKNWFAISIREWQLALEKGDGFTIAHVVMSNPNAAKITVYRDPAKLCQQGKLQLALMSPRQYTS